MIAQTVHIIERGLIWLIWCIGVEGSGSLSLDIDIAGTATALDYVPQNTIDSEWLFVRPPWLIHIVEIPAHQLSTRFYLHRKPSIITVTICAAARAAIRAVRPHRIGVLRLQWPIVGCEWPSRFGGNFDKDHLWVDIVPAGRIVDNLGSTDCSWWNRPAVIICGDEIARRILRYFVIIFQANVWWAVPAARGSILRMCHRRSAAFGRWLSAIGVAGGVETIQKRLDIGDGHIICVGE